MMLTNNPLPPQVGFDELEHRLDVSNPNLLVGGARNAVHTHPLRCGENRNHDSINLSFVHFRTPLLSFALLRSEASTAKGKSGAAVNSADAVPDSLGLVCIFAGKKVARHFGTLCVRSVSEFAF
jgi:hypothetical protein